MSSLARPLFNQEQVRDFFRDVLNIDLNDHLHAREWAQTFSYVSECENANRSLNISRTSTLLATENRDAGFKTDAERWRLRSRIVQELFVYSRPDDDDKIRLGLGGAKPAAGLGTDKIACIVIGAPASGRSTIANKIADYYGAYVVDADYAKRKLPEYVNLRSGSTLLQEESAAITFPQAIIGAPPEFKTLFELCVEKGTNMVIPKIGHDAKKIFSFAQVLNKTLGYQVHLVAVSLDRKDVLRRALHRLRENKRYVPLSLLFDSYGNDPILSHYRLKRMNKDVFKSFGKVSTDVAKGHKAELIYADKENPVCFI